MTTPPITPEERAADRLFMAQVSGYGRFTITAPPSPPAE